MSRTSMRLILVVLTEGHSIRGHVNDGKGEHVMIHVVQGIAVHAV